MMCCSRLLLLARSPRRMVAPAVYHVVSPLLAMLGVFLMCAFVVYLVVPTLRKCGLELNDVGQKRKKREKAIKALMKALRQYTKGSFHFLFHYPYIMPIYCRSLHFFSIIAGAEAAFAGCRAPLA